jgi:hypothetical protein
VNRAARYEDFSDEDFIEFSRLRPEVKAVD